MLDEQGTVLLTVRGLRMGTGTSETGERERVLSERLLTLEWQQRTLPEDAHGLSRTEAGSWLLIDTSDAADLLATMLTDALKSQGARMRQPALVEGGRCPRPIWKGLAVTCVPVPSMVW